MENQSTEEGAAANWVFAKNSLLPPKSPLFPIAAPSFYENANRPKVPYPRRRQHQRSPSASVVPHISPSWIDDLLNENDEEAGPKRAFHRRSSSDSVAFLDSPMGFARSDDIAEEELECGSVVSMQSRESHDFDRIEEEQLMCMFADVEPFQKPPYQSSETPMLGTISHEKRTENLPAPSDHSSVNEQSYEEKKSVVGNLKCEPEVQSAEHFQPSRGDKTSSISSIDPLLDPKRAKRILANRQSAQRSRVRKLQYISELERSVNALQAEVSALSPQLAYLDHQRAILNVDNSSLKQRIAALAQDKLFKDAHYEALKEEVHRLRQLRQQQQQQQQQDSPFDQQQQFGNLDLQAERKPDAVGGSTDFFKCTNSVAS